MSPTANTKYLIFTGGHHTSGLVVAQSLLSQGWQIIWFGHKYSMLHDRHVSAEYAEVTAKHIPFIPISAGKAYARQPLQLLRIPLGFFQAFFHLVSLKIKYRDQIRGVVSFGGYLAVPVVISAWLLRIPVVTHEQTAAAGWANRVISRFARKIAVTWPQSAIHYPNSKIVVTGLPLRSEITSLQTSPSSRPLPLIYVTGGKQGAHALNEVIFSSLTQLLESYLIVHQTGTNTIHNDYFRATEFKKTLPPDQAARYFPLDYLPADKVAETLSTADLVISRSGAHITYELAFLHKRAVLIPLPHSSHAEQEKNARLLADNGQATVLPQSQLNEQSLLTSIKNTLNLPPSSRLEVVDGTQNIIQLIESEFHEK